MIVYLASFPRSGNAWMRLMVHHYLARRAASWYRDEDGSANLARHPDGRPVAAFSDYTTEHDPGIVKRRLVNGCGPLLTETFRREVASLEEPYFVRTHERPFDRFLPGESVALLARHPGGALWSCWQSPHGPEGARTAQPSLEGVIAGHSAFGDWSAYHDAWLDRAGEVPGGFLLHRYEDLVAAHGDFARRLARLSGLGLRRRVDTLPPFAQWHEIDPRLSRIGAPDAWRGALQERQWRRLMGQHGAVMARLGYPVETPPASAEDVAPRPGPGRASGPLERLRAAWRGVQRL